MADDAPSEVPPPPAPSPAPPPTDGAPPPAAKIVVSAERKEGDTDLAAELTKKLKDREIRLAELEDENHRLKSPPAPKPAPAPKKGGGWGFFQED